jgi:hypothetical protein
MNSIARLALLACMLAAFAAALPAAAQEPASPAPSETSAPTLMDRQYDGNTHVMIAPYIWGPNVKGNFQFSIPTLPHRPPRITQPSTQIGPSDYLPKLNSAAMAAFDVRKGLVDLFGDAIYLNATTTATVASSISGPLGKIQIPVSVDASAHLSTAIWEVAAGYTFAHGHNADLSGFAGVREFPANLTIGYTATVGRKNILAPSGSISASDYNSDIIFGLRGRAFFGDDHWYVPYYADLGTSISTTGQTWQAYSGIGYAFPHGQSIIALWRALNYSSFPPTSHTQKLNLAGPLLGYTFNL